MCLPNSLHNPVQELSCWSLVSVLLQAATPDQLLQWVTEADANTKVRC